ncbi:MAG: TetR family transcriptional regulator [Azospirillaceae bacterium]
MPRPKSLSDREVLETANRLLHAHGPEGLSFGKLARACGLSSSTLVQRFANKDGLMRATLMHAWDGLDARTASLAARLPRSPEGAVRLLVALSQDYGDIERYADNLLILREDLRDPVVRARGKAWKGALSAVLEDCFAGQPGMVPGVVPGIGLMLAAQWQGALLWWSFDPEGPVERFVEARLRAFVAALTGPSPRPGARDRPDQP